MQKASKDNLKNSYLLAIRAIRAVFVVATVALMLSVSFGLSKAAASGPSSNRLLNYQLRLLDSSGSLVSDGTYNVKLTVFDAASGGNQLYSVCTADGTATGTPTAVQMSFLSGVSSILIGDTGNTCASGSAVALPADLFNNTLMYLGVTVESDSEMSPRKRIVGTGYALNADRLDDLETSNAGGTNAFVPVTDAFGNLTLTGNPQGTGATQGTLAINPTAADANEALFGVSLNSSVRFTIDEDGDVYVSNDLQIDGNTTIGSADTDTVMFNADIASHILPSADDIFDLGTDGSRWRDLYLGGQSIHIGSSSSDEAVISFNGSVLNFDTSTTAEDISFNTNQLYLDSSTGRVGIGTTSPNYDLHVAGSALATNLYVSGATFMYGSKLVIYDDKLLGFGGGSGVPDISMGYRSADDKLVFVSGTNLSASEMLTIDSTGKIGIGTDSPSELLELSAAAQATLRITSTGDGLGAANEIGSIEFYGNDISAPGAGVKAAIRVITEDSLGDDAAIDFYTSDGTTNEKFAMRVSPDGYLGVGTIAPQSMLHISGTHPMIRQEVRRTGGGASFTINDLYLTNTTSGSSENIFRQGVLGNLGSPDPYLNYFWMSVDENSATPWTDGHFVLNSDGYIGVGTVAPDRQFTVAQTADNNGIRVYGYDDLSTDYLDFRVDSFGQALFDSSSNMVFQSVGGYQYFRSASNTIFNLGDAGGTNEFRIRDSGNNIVTAIDSDGNVQSDGTLSIDGTGDSYVMGNFGIGTSTPATILNVVQKADNNGIKVNGYDDRSSSYLNLDIDASGYSNIDASNGFRLQHAGTNLAFINSDSTNGFRLYDDVPMSFGLLPENRYQIGYESSSDTLRMVRGTSLDTGTIGIVMDSNGHVGVGLTSPEDILHVKAADGVTGSMKIEGGKSAVTAIGEINSQLDFGSNDGSVNNTDNVGGRIASVTELANGAKTGLAFYTFVQSRTPEDLAEAVRISGDGELGIGTTDPTHLITAYQQADSNGFRLHGFDDESTSYGEFYISGSGSFITNASGNITYNPGGYVYFNSSSHVYMDLGDSAGSDEFKLRDSGTNEIFTIDSDGNVSTTARIETAAHANNVGLNLPTFAGAPSAVTGTAEGDIVWDSTGDALYVYTGSAFAEIGGGGSGLTQVGSMTTSPAFGDSTADDDWLGLGASAGRIEFDDQTTDEVNILGANVGIGTSSPQANLHIYGADPTLNFENTNFGGQTYAWDMAAGHLTFQRTDTANVNSVLRISGKGDGYFSSPIYYGGTLQIYSTDVIADGTNYEYLSMEGHRGARFLIRSRAGGTKSVQPIVIEADGTDTFDQLVLATNGNIGIGDTDPASLFTVGSGDSFQVDGSGNITTSGDAAINGGDLTTTASTANLFNTNATTLNIGGAATTLNLAGGSGSTGCTIDGSGNLSCSGTGGDFATRELNNLQNVAINTHLLPDTDDAWDLGTDANRWRDLYLGPASIHIGNSTSDEGTISFSGTALEFNTAAAADDIAFFTDDLYLDKDAGLVGIGTASPDYTLDVAGDIGINQYLRHNDDTNTYTYFTDDRFSVVAGGTEMLGLIYSSGIRMLAPSGTDIDFNVGTNQGMNISDAGLVSTRIEDAGTSAVLEALRIERRTTGTAANGLGVAIDFYLEEDGGTSVQTARFSNDWVSVGSDSELSTSVRDNGSMAEIMKSKPTRTNFLHDLGVYTDAPKYEFDVTGTVYASSDVRAGNDLIVDVVNDAFIVDGDAVQVGIGTHTGLEGKLNIFDGSAGSVAPYGGSDAKLVIESSDNAYIQLLTPAYGAGTGNKGYAGLLIGDPTVGSISGGVYLQGGNATDSNRMVLTAGGVNGLFVDPSGYLSVNNLHGTSGTSLCYNSAVQTGWNTLSVCSSSIRYKENVVDLNVDIGTFMQLRPVDFDWKEGMGVGPSVGFIAEEVEQIYPEVINYNFETGEVEGIEYRLMTAHIVSAMQQMYNLLDGSLKLNDAGDAYDVGPVEEATPFELFQDSKEFNFGGAYWDVGSASSAQLNLAFKNTVTSEDEYRLSLSNDNDEEIVYFGNEGDVGLKGRLYLSDRGAMQSDRYMYYDGSAGPGGDFMRTNAAGWATGSYDFAEMYPSNDELEPGELVMVDAFNPGKVKRATNELESNKYLLSGIVSTRPGFLAGNNEQGSYPIALEGRVPTRVNIENGAINVGDPITISSVPGQGMRAGAAGYVVGIALEAFDGVGENVITVMLKSGWYNGQNIEQPSQEISGSASELFAQEGVIDLAGQVIVGIGALQGLNDLWSIDSEGKLTAKAVEAEEIQAEELTVKANDEKTTIGEGVLPLGASNMVIENPAVKFNSRIFVTFFGNIEGNWWISERTDGRFVINLSKVTSTEVPFEYWILDVADERTPPVPMEEEEPVEGGATETPVTEEQPAEEGGEEVIEEEPAAEETATEEPATEEPAVEETTTEEEEAPAAVEEEEVTTPAETTEQPVEEATPAEEQPPVEEVVTEEETTTEETVVENPPAAEETVTTQEAPSETGSQESTVEEPAI